MPSLSALQEFKTSFNEIGGERADLEARNIPLNDLQLPDTEAAPAVDASAPAAEDTAAGGDFDFGDLLGAMPEDLAPDVDDGVFDSSAAAPETDGPETGDSGVPESLLSGLADELESAARETEPLDLGGEEMDLGGESPAPDADFDLGDLGGKSAETPGADQSGEDKYLGRERPAPDAEFELGDLGDLGGESAETPGVDQSGEEMDLGGESPAPDADFDLGDLGDLGGESAEMPAAGADQGGEEIDLGGESPAPDADFDLGDLGDLGGESAETPGADQSGEEMDLGGESPAPDADFDLGDLGGETPAAAPEGDAFDNFNLEGKTKVTDVEAGADAGADDFNDDFSLPGIDDLLTRSTSETPGPAPKAKGVNIFKKAGGKPKREEIPGDIEEIRLSDEELENFQKTLSGYPLNLRVACGELIVEQMVAPDQMARLIRMLVRGAPAKETAALAGKILGRTIDIPKGFEKSTGEALEAEQASFAYIFVHHFLPVLRLFTVIAVLAACVGFLIYRFVYTPLKAESIYKIGYGRIFAGEYERANERFTEAFNIRRDKDWFYKYAEAFRDERQYYRAEEKYDELLRYYPRDKKGVLDYAALETYYLYNYQKANNLLQRELLDYAPNDPDGLLAFGDNNLAWGEVDASKYDDARFAYARLLEQYGWKDPVVERMMKYFIRVDNLKEVLPLYAWFRNDSRRILSAGAMAELGGYLLDKRLEEVRGVPNEYVEYIEGIRELLLDAVKAAPSLPEPHYHLARYYKNLDNAREERITLEVAIRFFDAAKEESVRRRLYRIDAHQRYADNLIEAREFAPAEEQLVRGINLYEDALSRRLISSSPGFGRLYAGLGDLEYFTKTGDMEAALGYYHRAEQNGWAPPEILYRMGAAYYQLENWGSAFNYLFNASSSLPLNRRLLFALGNTALKRGDYFPAQGYYNRLLDILETQRSRLPVLLPNDRPEYLELAERLMMARNNAGVAYEALASQTGDRRYRTRAQALYAEAARAWDARTRDPRTMIRSGSTPLPALNSRNTLYPQSNYEPQIFIRIDRDVLEPSHWEELAPVAGLR
jgi:hypothetical protein